MFNEYPQLLSQTNLSAEKVSNQIKEIRRTIAHGYAYYYDFKNDRSSKYLMILLDKLIRCMSLKLIGFSNDDISNFMPFYAETPSRHNLFSVRLSLSKYPDTHDSRHPQSAQRFFFLLKNTNSLWSRYLTNLC